MVPKLARDAIVKVTVQETPIVVHSVTIVKSVGGIVADNAEGEILGILTNGSVKQGHLNDGQEDHKGHESTGVRRNDGVRRNESITLVSSSITSSLDMLHSMFVNDLKLI